MFFEIASIPPVNLSEVLYIKGFYDYHLSLDLYHITPLISTICRM